MMKFDLPSQQLWIGQMLELVSLGEDVALHVDWLDSCMFCPKTLYFNKNEW